MALLVTAVERTTRKPDIAANKPVSSATCFIQGGFSTFGSLPALMRSLTFETSDLRFFLPAIDAPSFQPTRARGSRGGSAESSRGVESGLPQQDSNPLGRQWAEIRSATLIGDQPLRRIASR